MATGIQESAQGLVRSWGTLGHSDVSLAHHPTDILLTLPVLVCVNLPTLQTRLGVKQ